MAQYRGSLPQLGDEVFLADSGLETDLIFNRGIDLPDFAAFALLSDADGTRALRDYLAPHVDVARAAGAGLVLETPTWRANRDWGARLGYSPEQLDRANREAVALVVDVRNAADGVPVVVSGCIGPRHDAYAPDTLMSAAEAEYYHADQIATFASTEADVVTAMTLTYVAEAVGIALAAADAGMPVVLSFTVETDGRLPDGTSIGEAITAVDVATDEYPSYYMLNCAHPTHFLDVLSLEVLSLRVPSLEVLGADLPSSAAGGSWLGRLRGIRANASRMSHAELDAAPELDAGDPQELGAEYVALRRLLPGLTVLGGCCGTDVRHVEAIAHAVLDG